MAIVKKKLPKAQTGKQVIKGRPLTGEIGAYGNMVGKAKAGDRQAQADLAKERAKQKTFGEGPGSGPSGAMPKPKMKMGGAVKKAENGGSLKPVPADKVGLGKLPTKVRNKMGFQKNGGSMKKCKYGCK